MDETLESAVGQTQSITETKKMINPRAEIDTSPPFGSVKEAVTLFGGSGSWIPLHVLRFAAAHGTAEFDFDKIEEQTAQLEKNLIMKEHETLNVLRELEAAKRFVEELKLNLAKEVSTFMESPDLSSDSQMSTPNVNSVGSLNMCPVPSPGLILMELNQAKLNLGKSTNDLTAIQVSVESLNKKMREDKTMNEKSSKRQVQGLFSFGENRTGARVGPQIANDAEPKNSPDKTTGITREVEQLNFEAEQFKKIAEGATYEVRKAMSEIEQTKTSIKMVEMRLTAAKKMEEAARAVEAIALAETKALSNGEVFLQKPEGVTLSYEEYFALTQKAQKAEELYKDKVVDFNPTCHSNEENPCKVAHLRKLEETKEEVKHKKKFVGEGPSKSKFTDSKKLVAEEGYRRGRSEHSQMQYSGHNSANFKFINSDPSHGHQDTRLLDGNESNLIKDESVSAYRSTISIGDILSRKLILQDDIVVGKHADAEDHVERREASFSQLLREQSGLILHSSRSTKDGNLDKQYFTQKKKFGFIHISFPTTKHSKKKTHVLN